MKTFIFAALSLVAPLAFAEKTDADYYHDAIAALAPGVLGTHYDAMNAPILLDARLDVLLDRFPHTQSDPAVIQRTKATLYGSSPIARAVSDDNKRMNDLMELTLARTARVRNTAIQKLKLLLPRILSSQPKLSDKVERLLHYLMPENEYTAFMKKLPVKGTALGSGEAGRDNGVHKDSQI